MTDIGQRPDGPGPNAWRQAVAALADGERLRLYARIVLGGVVAADLARDDRRRLDTLVAAGLVVHDQAPDVDPDARPGGATPVVLRADPDRFVELLHAAHGERTARTGPERFLVGGRVTSLPRRRTDRKELLDYLAARALPLLEEVTEPTLTARLRELAADPVGMRRALVDAGLVTRTRDGVAYWRTHVTRFDNVSEVLA